MSARACAGDSAGTAAHSAPSVSPCSANTGSLRACITGPAARGAPLAVVASGRAARLRVARGRAAAADRAGAGELAGDTGCAGVLPRAGHLGRCAGAALDGTGAGVVRAALDGARGGAPAFHAAGALASRRAAHAAGDAGRAVDPLGTLFSVVAVDRAGLPLA